MSDGEAVTATYSAPPESEATATVVVVRDSGMIGWGVDFVIFIDGQNIATLRPSQKVEVRVREGSHIVGLSCGDCRESFRKEVGLVARRGERYPFRAFLLQGFQIQPSSQLD
jgi:hypothetical protein